jgi:hypothetical protein
MVLRCCSGTTSPSAVDLLAECAETVQYSTDALDVLKTYGKRYADARKLKEDACCTERDTIIGELGRWHQTRMFEYGTADWKYPYGGVERMDSDKRARLADLVYVAPLRSHALAAGDMKTSMTTLLNRKNLGPPTEENFLKLAGKWSALHCNMNACARAIQVRDAQYLASQWLFTRTGAPALVASKAQMLLDLDRDEFKSNPDVFLMNLKRVLRQQVTTHYTLHTTHYTLYHSLP